MGGGRLGLGREAGADDPAVDVRQVAEGQENGKELADPHNWIIAENRGFVDSWRPLSRKRAKSSLKLFPASARLEELGPGLGISTKLQ